MQKINTLHQFSATKK